MPERSDELREHLRAQLLDSLSQRNNMPKLLGRALAKFRIQNDVDDTAPNVPVLTGGLRQLEEERTARFGSRRVRDEERQHRIAAESSQRIAEQGARRALNPEEVQQQRDAELREKMRAQAQKRATEERRRREIEDIQRKEDLARDMQDRVRKCSSPSIRDLRALLREKYKLDHQIWDKRNVLRVNQKIVLKDCERADNILRSIYTIIDAWEANMFTREEWSVAQQIKESLVEQRSQQAHVWWCALPPWVRIETYLP